MQTETQLSIPMVGGGEQLNLPKGICQAGSPESGSALRKTTGSASAKLNADPQPWKTKNAGPGSKSEHLGSTKLVINQLTIIFCWANIYTVPVPVWRGQSRVRLWHSPATSRASVWPPHPGST